MSDERKQRQLMSHGKRESQYLRLRRTKIGLDDFKTVKVIGKGAFGEACYQFHSFLQGRILLQLTMCKIGSTCAKSRFRQDLCHENTTESRNAEA